MEKHKVEEISDKEEEDGQPKSNVTNGCGFIDWKFHWTETSSEIEIEVLLKTNFKVKASDVVVEITRNHLKAGLKGYTPVIDGDLYDLVKVEECIWVTENNARSTGPPGTTISITLEKVGKIKRWPKLIKTGPQNGWMCSQRGPKEILDNELTQYSWYQRDWDKQAAEVILRLEDKNGGFVIQLTEDGSALTLSVLRYKIVNREVRHIHLWLNGKGLIIGENKFDSILEFVDYFRKRRFAVLSGYMVDSGSLLFQGTPLSKLDNSTLYDAIHTSKYGMHQGREFLVSSGSLNLNPLPLHRIPMFQLNDGPSQVAIDRGLAIVKPFKLKEPLSENIKERLYYLIINSGSIKQEEEIGGGSFGKVYKGIWTIDRYSGSQPGLFLREINVALKDFSDDDDFDDDTIKDIIREGSVMLNFDHVNILGFFGIEVTGSVYSLVLEYIPEGSLLSYITTKEFESMLRTTNNLLLEFWLQILNGMIYLEKKKYIHKDLALRNCLVKKVDNRYIVKVSDFGLMRYAVKGKYERSTKFQARWVPPEVLRSNIFTHKSDVWSFGIVGWEIFTLGKHPHDECKNFKDCILNGMILEKPDLAPDQVYQMMKDCWEIESDKRPTFSDLGSMGLLKVSGIEIERLNEAGRKEREERRFILLLSRRSMRSSEMFGADKHGRVYDMSEYYKSADSKIDYKIVDPIELMK